MSGSAWPRPRLPLLLPLLRPLGLALLALLVAMVLLDTYPGVENGLVGRNADAATRAAARTRLGLDQPWFKRLLDYATALLHGDLGRSWSNGEPVTRLLAERLPVSLLLLLPGFLLGHALALWLVIHDRGRQQWASTLALCSLAGGIVLLALLARALGGALALPVQGLPLSPWWQTLMHLLLPTLVLATSSFGLLYLRYRQHYQQALAAPFTLAARARGESGGARWSALRDLRGLVLTRLLFDFPLLLLGGAVLETLFAIPGLGSRLVPAVLSGDQPVVLGCVLCGGLLFALLRMLLTLLLARLDPRLIEHA